MKIIRRAYQKTDTMTLSADETILTFQPIVLGGPKGRIVYCCEISPNTRNILRALCLLHCERQPFCVQLVLISKFSVNTWCTEPFRMSSMPDRLRTFKRRDGDLIQFCGFSSFIRLGSSYGLVYTLPPNILLW